MICLLLVFKKNQVDWSQLSENKKANLKRTVLITEKKASKQIDRQQMLFANR